MKVPVYVDDPQARLRVTGGRCEVLRDGEVAVAVPVKLVEVVLIHAAAAVPLRSLRVLLSAGVRLVLLDGLGRCVGRLEPRVRYLPAQLMAQMRALDDEAFRLDVSRQMVIAKLENQRVLLRDRRRRSPAAGELTRTCDMLRRLARRARQASDRSQLRGLEGVASRQYFRALAVDGLGQVGFWRRDRRGPDFVNNAINYTSALLREHVVGAVVRTGLHPGMSVYHEPRGDRPALVFDLMEEFRPVLLEATVLAVLGLGAADPQADVGGPDARRRLSARARRALVTRFRYRLGLPARARQARQGASYADMVLGQARRLAAAVRTRNADRYRGFRWR